jgi:putative transposase
VIISTPQLSLRQVTPNHLHKNPDRPDQGFQYRHPLWRDALRLAGLTQSMSRKGTCLDNAVMEGFFSHLKEEWFRIQKPETLEEFHTGLTDYLSWWNTTRIQERLGYLSPDEYRAQETATA